MDLLLSRWSAAAQIVSALLIVVFFVILSRSIRRIELRSWLYAWVVNLFAALAGLAGKIPFVLLLGVALAVVVVRRPRSGWLAAGFVLRALLALVDLKQPFVLTLIDAAAQWVMALGCALALYRTVQQELLDANQELLAAKDALQELVDRDSLTGLANRRALPGILRDAFESGATILFLDLNDFKDINDSYGHHAGDECLRQFARAVQTSFRPGDHVIRYAGDEFVVVAPAVEPQAIAERIGGLRERLKFEQHGGPQIRFSIGAAYLAPKGDAEEALREADRAMYRDKKAKTLKMRVPR